MCFQSCKLHDMKKWQSLRYETSKILKEVFEVSIKTW